MIEAILTNIVTYVVTSKYVLYYLAYCVVLGAIFWSMWVTLNIAYNRQKRLVYKLLLYVMIIPGALIDVIFNFTVATLLFWERPHESTLSMRLTRYISCRTPDKLGYANYGFRTPLAVWFATNLVEPWQRGHIGLEKYGYPAARDAMKWVYPLLKKLKIG